MRHASLVALAALLALPATASAQHAEYYFDLGATYARPLVNDAAFADEIEVQQSTAPTIRVGAAVPFSGPYHLGAEIGYGWGGYHADYGDASNDLGNVSTLTLQATVGGPVVERLRWRAAVGAINYMPSEDTGIFAQGGPWKPIAGLALEYRFAVTKAFDLRLVGRADVHPFNTKELGARGFGGSQYVPRFALGIGLWRFGA